MMALKTSTSAVVHRTAITPSYEHRTFCDFWRCARFSCLLGGVPAHAIASLAGARMGQSVEIGRRPGALAPCPGLRGTVDGLSLGGTDVRTTGRICYAALATGFLAGTAQGAPEGVLRVAIGADPATFDPAFNDLPIGNAVDLAVMEGLFRLDPKNNIQKGLATDYAFSADGMVFTVKIKTGKKFSNGNPLNAEAVAAASTGCWTRRSARSIAASTPRSEPRRRLARTRSNSTSPSRTATC